VAPARYRIPDTRSILQEVVHDRSIVVPSPGAPVVALRLCAVIRNRARSLLALVAVAFHPWLAAGPVSTVRSGVEESLGPSAGYDGLAGSRRRSVYRRHP